MKKLFFFLCFAFIFVGCATVEKKESTEDKNLKLLEENAKNSEAKDEDFVAGKKLLLDGKAEASLGYLEKSKAKETPFFLGLAYYSLGKYDKAEPLLEKAIAENIYPEEAAYNLAFIAYEKNDAPKAISLMTKTLSIKPAHAGANYFLGSWYYKQENYEKALEYYKNTVKTEPSKSAGWEGVFYSLISLSDYEKAWEVRDNLDKKETSIVYNLMLVAEKTGRFSEGISLADSSGFKTDDIVSEKIVLLTKSGKFSDSAVLAKTILAGQSGFVILDRGFSDSLSWAFIIESSGNLNLVCKKSDSDKEKEIKIEEKNGTFFVPEKKKNFNNYEEFSRETINFCK